MKPFIDMLKNIIGLIGLASPMIVYLVWVKTKNPGKSIFRSRKITPEEKVKMEKTGSGGLPLIGGSDIDGNIW